jgi:hypothetical protein
MLFNDTHIPILLLFNKDVNHVKICYYKRFLLYPLPFSKMIKLPKIEQNWQF